MEEKLEDVVDVVESIVEEAIDNGFIATFSIADENEILTIKTKEEIANIILFMLGVPLVNGSMRYTISFKKGEEEYYAVICDDLFVTLDEIFESHSVELPNILPNTFRLIDNT